MAKPNYPTPMPPAYSQPTPRGGRSVQITPTVQGPQYQNGPNGPSPNPMVDGAPQPGEPPNSKA